MKLEPSLIARYQPDAFIGADLLSAELLADSEDGGLEAWERAFIVHQLLVNHLRKTPAARTGISTSGEWAQGGTG